MNNYDENLMNIALNEAITSYKNGDVPVGCVVASGKEIISKAHNQQNSSKISTYHAEMLAIEKACIHLGTGNLSGCTMYVTLEPCLMCLGAILSSKINTLYIGAISTDNGAIISRYPMVKEDLIYPNKLDYFFKKTISPYIIKRFFRYIRKSKEK